MGVQHKAAVLAGYGSSTNAILHDGEIAPANQLVAGKIRTPVLIATDIAAFGLSAALAQVLVGQVWGRNWLHRIPQNATVYGTAWHGWALTAIMAGMLVYLGTAGHYTRRVPFWMAVRDVGVVCIAALAGDYILSTAVNGMHFNTETTLRWVLFTPALFGCRAAARSALRRAGLWSLNTIIVGDRAAVQRVQEAFASDPALGYRFVGQSGFAILDSLHDPAAWASFARTRQAQFVVIAGRHHDIEVESQALSALDRAGIPFACVSPVEALPVSRRQPQYFLSHDVTLMTYKNNLANPLYRALKRSFDVCVAGTMVLLLAPLLATLAVLIRMEGGPALFHHKRIGRNGRTFRCMKFRSMRVNSATLLSNLLASDPAARAEWNERQKLQNDPRISRVGHFLRKTSLDELPQLFNVLRGEMSLVGPRPIVKNEVDRYADDIAFYYETRPGLTGLWQVSGRSNTSYERRVRLDVWYVKNWSLWHDLVIMLKTIPALLLKEGAV